MKKTLFFLMAISAAINPLFAESTYKNCLKSCPKGAPESNIVVERSIYTLSSNKRTKLSDWVAYKVTQSTIGPSHKRNWKRDPSIPADDTLEPSDYKGAYSALDTDRGHQAPLASFSATSEWSTTNYLSNITPQDKDLNRGPWMQLEAAVRSLTTSFENVWVMTGPIFSNNGIKLPNANEPHEVPSGYWKIISVENENRIETISFQFDQDTDRKAFYCDFQSSIADITKLSKLNFDLPESSESNNSVIRDLLNCESTTVNPHRSELEWKTIPEETVIFADDNADFPVQSFKAVSKNGKEVSYKTDIYPHNCKELNVEIGESVKVAKNDDGHGINMPFCEVRVTAYTNSGVKLARLLRVELFNPSTYSIINSANYKKYTYGDEVNVDFTKDSCSRSGLTTSSIDLFCPIYFLGGDMAYRFAGEGSSLRFRFYSAGKLIHSSYYNIYEDSNRQTRLFDYLTWLQINHLIVGDKLKIEAEINFHVGEDKYYPFSRLYINLKNKEEYDVEKQQSWETIRKLHIKDLSVDLDFFKSVPHLKELKLEGKDVSGYDISKITSYTELDALTLKGATISHPEKLPKNLKKLSLIDVFYLQTIDNNCGGGICVPSNTRFNLPNLTHLLLERFDYHPNTNEEFLDLSLIFTAPKLYNLTLKNVYGMGDNHEGEFLPFSIKNLTLIGKEYSVSLDYVSKIPTLRSLKLIDYYVESIDPLFDIEDLRFLKITNSEYEWDRDNCLRSDLSKAMTFFCQPDDNQ